MLRFRALTTITITWKNHENCSHTNKNSTRYRSWHTTVRGESYLYDILITCICGGSHSSVCYYLSQPAKGGCFHNSTIILLNTVCIWKYQFVLVNVVCNEGCVLQPEEFLENMKQYITFEHFLNRNLKEERRKNKRFAICENSYIYILYNIYI